MHLWQKVSAWYGHICLLQSAAIMRLICSIAYASAAACVNMERVIHLAFGLT
jgi:hypothetical protein